MKSHADGWRPAIENSQQALITYRDGIERLIVAIEVDDADAKSMVWLLPVPAAPKQVHVDILSRFPGVHGTEVYGGAQEHFRNMRTAAVFMQIWPPLAGGILDALFSDRSMPRPAATKTEAPKGEPVVVHERVEKQGMVSEVITAREGSALFEYLAGKGLNLKAGAVPTLEFYIGKDYTFVASWFSSGAEQSKGQSSSLIRGVEIRFPAEEMFFPLFPTSGYGERVVPASIRVAGHVTPRLFADIAARTSTGYYVSNSRGEEGPGPLAGTDLYTKIDIDAPAKAFTQDLWISPKPHRQSGLEMATFIVRHPMLVSVALLVVLSGLVSLVVGWPIFRELRTEKGALRLMLVGLGNCVSLLGMLATASALPDGWKRRTGFLVAFSLLFMLAAAVVTGQAGVLLEPMKPKSLPVRPPTFEIAPRNPDSSTVIVVPRIVDAAPAPASPAAPVIAADIEALYQQALAMESSGKAAESIRIYRRAARAGSGKAAKRLGEIFEKGVPGVSRDYAESLQWYDLARQLGEKVEPAAAR